MSDTLAEHLADRLDIQPEQTDRLVRTLARLIKTQAARDGQVRVPGLGIFEQQADTLSFEPDPHFAETVNPKYAHLPTVSVALPVSDSFLPDEPDPVVEEEAPEAQGDTTPTVEADDVALPAFSSPPVEQEDLTEEEEIQREEEFLPASFLDEAEPAETDTADPFVHDITPPPLPPDKVEQDIFESSAEEEEPAVSDEGVPFEDPEPEEEPVADDEGSTFDEPDFEPASDTETASVFTDETPLEDHADEEDEDFIASLLADEPENLDDEEDEFREGPFDWEDHEEEAFDDAEPLEDDVYDTLEEESSSFEEDTFLEESEPSAWAPPGTRWTGENKDQLVPIEEDETEDAASSLPPFSLEDTEPNHTAFAPSPLKAVPKAPQVKPSATADDLPPRPPARIRHQKQDSQSSGRSLWPWLLAALLFVVVAGGAYYYFNLREQPIATNVPPPSTEQPTDTDDPATTPPTEEEPLTQDPATETDDATDNGATGQPEDEESPSDEETPAEPPPASTGPIDRAQGGYTLVVGSRGSREAADAGAERIRQTLNDDSIPVDVLQGTVNGTTRYRIGVGQVETTDAALALKQRLGNRIPADAWVTRILPDS
ncbi:MAG TPA: SPOR domain-containing protein [Rhodothermales bacterium]|nr:SPOR domain-containing protein [Rhodothermales bacterium]